MTGQAFLGCTIFDGHCRHDGCALVVRKGRVSEIVDKTSVPSDCHDIRLDGALIAPGFVDLQVNGGGGVLLNDDPSIDAIRTITAAHVPFGTTALLPTLITDTREKTAAAIAAADDAIDTGVHSCIGLHLEGPHLAMARKGAHDAALIRAMDDDDEAMLVAAARRLPSLLMTVAPESVTSGQIAALADAGATVSLGHTDASLTQVREAIAAGATCVTHLFNAMSPLGHREPGVVGGALSDGRLYAGLIADGFHVAPEAVGIALRAKQEPGKIFLVTDAMATIGTQLKRFTLGGRDIERRDGRLTLPDGTLAGADLDMISAVRFMVDVIGVPVDEALRMASLYPAKVLGRDAELGQLVPGARGDFVVLGDALAIEGVWQQGEQVA